MRQPRSVFVGIALLLGVSGAVFAAGPDLSGTWTKTYDFSLDGSVSGKTSRNQVTISAAGDGTYTARYSGNLSANRSTFAGAYVNGSANIVTITQVDGSYVAIIAGQLQSDGSIVGTWYDSLGNAGDIVLTRDSVGSASSQTGNAGGSSGSGGAAAGGSSTSTGGTGTSVSGAAGTSGSADGGSSVASSAGPAANALRAVSNTETPITLWGLQKLTGPPVATVGSPAVYMFANRGRLYVVNASGEVWYHPVGDTVQNASRVPGAPIAGVSQKAPYVLFDGDKIWSILSTGEVWVQSLTTTVGSPSKLTGALVPIATKSLLTVIISDGYIWSIGIDGSVWRQSVDQSAGAVTKVSGSPLAVAGYESPNVIKIGDTFLIIYRNGYMAAQSAGDTIGTPYSAGGPVAGADATGAQKFVVFDHTGGSYGFGSYYIINTQGTVYAVQVIGGR